MKRKYLLFVFLFCLCLIIFPSNVEAKTTKKECSYRVEGGLSTWDTYQGNLVCTFSWSDAFLFGGYSNKCTFKRDSTGEGQGNISIIPTNAFKSWDTGFKMSSWFEKNKECPKYMVMDLSILAKGKARSNYSVFFANTTDQVEKIKKIAPNILSTYVDSKTAKESNFSSFKEKSIQKEEIEKDPNGDAAKACQQKKSVLDGAMALLETNKKKWEELNCQNYKLSQEEKDSVASSENIKWGRECKQILDNYNITVGSARSELKNYTEAGCIEKGTDIYNSYNDRIDALEEDADVIRDNIDEQNGSFDDEWEELGENVDLNNFNQDIGCEIFSEEPGSFGWLLNKVLGYIKVIGPILVVILSSLDFIKAVVGTDEKAMKEAQSKLIIRLVCALALFLVPTLVQLLFSFINEVPCML